MGSFSQEPSPEQCSQMLSPFKKHRWRAKREQRKHKLKLAPIKEETEIFLDEKYPVVRNIDTREEQQNIEDTSRTLGKTVERHEKENVREPVCDRKTNEKYRNEKWKLLQSIEPFVKRAHDNPAYHRNMFRNMNVRNQRRRTSFKQNGMQMKIPRG